MSKNNCILVLLTLTMLNACATNRHPAEIAREAPAAPVVTIPAPAPEYESRGISVEKDFHPLVPARAFCSREKKCGRNYGAYGYLIFTKRPTNEATRQRYLSICKAYMANLEDAGNYAHIASTQIATTFWLLASKPVDENSCDELIDRYDYARATEITASIHKLKSAGPILVASGQPDVAQTTTQELLIIDLGRMRNGDMDRAFAIWKDKISQDSKYWGKVFNLDLIVAEFSSFIRKYGGTIVQTVKPG